MDAELGPPGTNFDRVSITTIPFDGPFFRTHAMQRHPVFYGKTGWHRLDAPDASYGVLYAGRDPYGAFIETFASAAGTRIVTTRALREKSLAELKATRALRLIDLTQSGTLVRIGADARLFAGSHEAAQLWSKALYGHPCKADGVLYPSRLDPVRHCIVLFEHRAPRLIELERQCWYAPGKLRMILAGIMDHYKLQLIETQFVVQRKRVSRIVRSGMFPETP